MDKQRLIVYVGVFTVLTCLFVFNGGVVAQSQSQLADQMDRVSAERLQQIDRLQITSIVNSEMFEGMESTSVYEKVTRDGSTTMVLVEDEGEFGEVIGYFDEMVGDMVRHASSIQEDTYQGRGVYRIFVDDNEFLTTLSSTDLLEEDLDETVPESATILLDRDELIVHQATFVQRVEGDGALLNIHLYMSDYQTHSGLPIPHVVEFEIEGLDQVISEEDIAEARSMMQELQAQLDQMPEAQRSMIESQLLPQMEQFEAMLEQGDLGDVRIVVSEVVVN